jgi:hypothetical protein
VGRNWVIGALLLVGSSSCWSLWLILQVPICKSYVDPLTLSAWMCFLSMGQSALLTSFAVPDLEAWKIHSLFELMGCVFAVSSPIQSSPAIRTFSQVLVYIVYYIRRVQLGQA